MGSASRGRMFDLSTLLVLGLVTLLFISLPGGCGDNGDDAEEVPETDVTDEVTPIPTMEIVDLEPGMIGNNEPVEADTEEQGEPDGENSEDAEEPSDQAEPEPDTDEPASGDTYVVQSGDTLYAIAVRFGVNLDALMAENGISDPNALQVGQELRIPAQN